MTLSQVIQSEDIYSINDFKKSYFKIISQNEGFYKVSSKLETSANEIPAAYGFVDADFYTDVITVGTDLKTFNVYIFEEDDGIFVKKGTSAPVPNDEVISSIKITYMVQSSTNPQLMVVTQSKSQKKMLIHAFLIQVDQDQKMTFKEIPELLVTLDSGDSIGVEPISFQISNDGPIIDYWLVSDGGVRKVINYDRTKSTNSYTVAPFTDFLLNGCPNCIDYNTVINNKLAAIGSHRLADLNGDGRADLVLESFDSSSNRFFEIYDFNDSGKFSLKKTIPIDPDYSLGNFSDLLNRKMMDLVFWHKKEKKIHIHYAQVGSGQAIGDTGQFSKAGFDYSIPSIETPSQSKPEILDLVPGAQIQDNASLLAFPLIRFADLNLNGFMDLIINTVDSSGANEIHIFPNNNCHAPENKKPECKIYDVEYTDKTIGIIKKKNAISTSLFDFGERG